jgi:hypothetical protein
MRYAKGRTGTARVAAFVAALALVLQSALAFAAPPVQRDMFGNLICADGSTGQSPRDGGHDGGHMPDCCLGSCGGTLQTVADLPASAQWQPVVATAATAAFPAPKTIPLHHRRTPANPRAPPAA